VEVQINFINAHLKTPQNLSGYQYLRTGLGYFRVGLTGNPNSEGEEFVEVLLL
jgi:hypothetical protein